MSVCVSDVAVLRLNRFANQAVFLYTKHNRDNGCNVLDRDDHSGRRAGRRQSKPSGAPRGHNFGVGEQLMRGSKADSRDEILEERAVSPSPIS